MEALVSGVVAAGLTLFDLDRIFYVPSKARRKVWLYCWYVGFLVGNGILASGLYIVFADAAPFKGWHPLLKALVIGTSYLALIRAKFTTFNYQGQEVPFGIEAVYEGAKGFVYKRINRIALDARYEETTDLASRQTLDALVSQAKIRAVQDALSPADEQTRTKKWIIEVLQDAGATELDKKLTLANFVLSGQRAKS